ncbi:MAG: pyridoxamine 5'-phosphate oxidase family protein, partial [Actinomycetota bacterium]
MTTRSPTPEVWDEARSIVERVVWATVATVGPDGRPRTRLMHPVWFWDADTPTALVSARPTPLKVRHLAAQPAISCHYWDPEHHTVAIDAVASWVPLDRRQAAWDRIS